MAEVEKQEKKSVETHDEGISYKTILIILFYVFAIIVTIILAILIVFINPETAKNFLNFLYGLEIFFAVYLLVLFFYLRVYIKRFEEQSEKLGKIFEEKYIKQEEEKENLTSEQFRFEKAKKHIYSQYKEEWKIGIIELDTILKDLLKLKNYSGDTVGELLKSAEEKGLKIVSEAWEAHKIRNKIVHEGIKYDMSNEMATRALRNYTTAFNELGING